MFRRLENVNIDLALVPVEYPTVRVGTRRTPPPRLAPTTPRPHHIKGGETEETSRIAWKMTTQNPKHLSPASGTLFTFGVRF